MWPNFPERATVFGWGGFAHYRGAPTGLIWQVNLPDIASSRTPLGYASFEVSDWFGWGHVCQRMGVYEIPPDLIEPNTPTSYGMPAGIEFAEWDMYYLRSRMTAAHREAENDYMMLQTARGWRAHNVMDSVVHFSYFLGGSAYNWTIEHSVKESWAESILFALATGYPNEPWGSYQHGMGASGHGGIIRLAPQCFRKNRQTVDFMLPYSGSLAAGPVGLLSCDAADGEADPSLHR